MYTERIYKKLQSQTLHPIQKGGKFGFVDKRSNPIAQRKLIYSIQNINPQLSILRDEKNKSFDKSETSVSGVKQMKFREQQVDYNNGTQARVAYNYRYNYFLQNGRGCYANIANTIGSGFVYFGGNSHGHSEEKILDANNKKVLNLSDLNSKRVAAQQGGKINLNIYTELQPCNGNYGPPFNCDELLGLALTDSSTVYYSFNRGQNLEDIDKQIKAEEAGWLRDSLIELAYSDYDTITSMRQEICDYSLGDKELSDLINMIRRYSDDCLISNYASIKRDVLKRENLIFGKIREHYLAIQDQMDTIYFSDE